MVYWPADNTTKITKLLRHIKLLPYLYFKVSKATKHTTVQYSL